MMHLDYAVQVIRKERRLLAALAEVGVMPAVVNPPTLGPKLGYRTRARLGVRVVGGEVLVGFRESFSNRVGRMGSCETLVPQLSALIEPLRELVAGLSLPHKIPQIELAAGDSRCALILRHLSALTAADEAKLIAFEKCQRVCVHVQPQGYDSIRRLPEAAPVAGGVPGEPSTFSETPATSYLGYSNPEFGLHFRFLPWDFTQVNLRMNRLLVTSALLALDAPPGARVLDMFCGIGNFSLACASARLEVTGLELAADSIARARMNAAFNGLDSQCEFQVRDLYHPACEPPGETPYMLLDPPRSGAGPNLRSWLDGAKPLRVVYVSCHPGSFAADAKVLADQGYELKQVGVFDMFPHTSHVETLGCFSR
jgi:23S rRNA (uracil1939-C5)-methyltransferase